jgi:hypothetical protein
MKLKDTEDKRKASCDENFPSLILLCSVWHPKTVAFVDPTSTIFSFLLLFELSPWVTLLVYQRLRGKGFEFSIPTSLLWGCVLTMTVLLHLPGYPLLRLQIQLWLCSFCGNSSFSFHLKPRGGNPALLILILGWFTTLCHFPCPCTFCKWTPSEGLLNFFNLKLLFFPLDPLEIKRVFWKAMKTVYRISALGSNVLTLFSL